MDENVVKLTYFKTGGKYYSDAIYFAKQGATQLEVRIDLITLRKKGRLPGLEPGNHSEFHILMRYQHVPFLIFSTTEV